MLIMRYCTPNTPKEIIPVGGFSLSVKRLLDITTYLLFLS